MEEYQRALEKARELHETSNPEVRSALEKVFTELVEDEDERIRKALIDGFTVMKESKNCGKTFSKYKIPVEDILAWLEKLGKGDMGISEATKQKLEDNLHEALGKETPESCNKFLDEQGEQKSMKTCAEYYNQDNELKMPELSEFQNKLADILMYREYDGPDETEDDIAKGRLEYELAAIRLSEELLPLAQKEQKPADKAEQKFEIGDLITNGILVGKIDKIHKWGYHAYFGDHYADVPDAENWHKWTVQDAKAGDVLTCESGWTCIFKTLVNDETFSSYCFMDNTKWFCETGSECHTLKEEFVKAYNGKIYPATKEQRDLLFQKMHEAGYEWDPKKLELKKNPLEHPFCNSIKDKTWTEEDDRFFEELYKEFDQGYKDASIEQLKDIYSRRLQWLESIKSRLT